MNNNFEMNPQQVQDRLHSCGLSAEEVTRVNLCIAEGKINPSGWVFLTDENLGSSLRTSISQQAVPATGSKDSDEADYDYTRFPFYFDALKRVGLQTPYEQYTLYISFGVFLYGAYTPFRKAVFLNKWLHETDPSLKDIWAARANLSLAEQNGGERYLQELKRVPKRYAVLPLSFLLIEGIRSGYRKLSHVFTHKQ